MSGPGMFDATTPDGWVIPLGYVAHFQDPPAHCRSCRAEILWATTPKGARAPLNRDGVNHFVTCPQSREWGKRKGKGGR